MVKSCIFSFTGRFWSYHLKSWIEIAVDISTKVDRKKEKIRVEYYSNVYQGNKIVSGNIQKVFEGTRADELCDTIAKHVPNLRNEHYMYLGRELMNAQIALEKQTKYVHCE